MTTLTGSPARDAVRNSAISIAKPPSPTLAITCRPGKACWMPIEYGRPGAIVARLPDR
jgi:hypothetical protein